MQYRGYKVTAEVTLADEWSLTDSGELDDKIGDGATFEVTGYFLYKDGEFQEFYGGTDLGVEDIRELVDAHIAEQAKVAA